MESILYPIVARYLWNCELLNFYFFKFGFWDLLLGSHWLAGSEFFSVQRIRLKGHDMTHLSHARVTNAHVWQSLPHSLVVSHDGFPFPFHETCMRGPGEESEWMDGFGRVGKRHVLDVTAFFFFCGKKK